MFAMTVYASHGSVTMYEAMHLRREITNCLEFK